MTDFRLTAHPSAAILHLMLIMRIIFASFQHFYSYCCFSFHHNRIIVISVISTAKLYNKDSLAEWNESAI